MRFTRCDTVRVTNSWLSSFARENGFRSRLTGKTGYVFNETSSGVEVLFLGVPVIAKAPGKPSEIVECLWLLPASSLEHHDA